jgi:predicted O-linked N-acetylglucosamine transferase (SPINDLY family)
VLLAQASSPHRTDALQVLYKGYAGTMSGPFVSHVISDRFTTTPQLARTQLGEKTLLLPHTLFANSHRYEFAAVPLQSVNASDRALVGVPDWANPVLCSFNSLYKVRVRLLGVRT